MFTKFSTAVAVLILVSPVFAQYTMEEGWVRDGTFGDRILGDIHKAGEGDVFVGRAVQGSVLRMTLGPAGRASAYRVMSDINKPPVAAFFAVVGGAAKVGGEHTLVEQIEPTGIIPKKKGRGAKLLPTKLPSTGEYRIVVLTAVGENGNPFAGDFLLRAKVKSPKKFKLEDPFPAGGGEIDAIFSAVAESVVNITIRPGRGTPLPELVDILQPDSDDPQAAGESIFEGLEPKVKKTSIKLKKVKLSRFGDYRIRLRSEVSGVWRVQVKVKPPKVRGQKIDVRDGEPSPPWPVRLSILNGLPRADVRDLEGTDPDELIAGGASEFFVFPGTSVPPGKAVEYPMAIAVGSCGTLSIEPEGGSANQPDEVHYVCSMSVARGDAGAFTWESYGGRNRPMGFEIAVETEAGPGESVFSDLTRLLDQPYFPTDYTETRSYGTDGALGTWKLTVRDIRWAYRNGWGPLSWWVDVEKGEESLGSFPVPAWLINEKK